MFPSQFLCCPHGGGVALQQHRTAFLQCGPKTGQKIRKSRLDMEDTFKSLMRNKPTVCLNDSLRLFALEEFNMKKFENETKVGHVKATVCFSMWNCSKRLWKLIMQPVRTKNCTALCLDSSGLILAVSLIHREPEGEAVSFHYKCMSASKSRGPHRPG